MQNNNEMNNLLINTNINMKLYIPLLIFYIESILRVVTDKITRNVLIYTNKEEGIHKFKNENRYPDSLKQIDKKITKYKKQLQDALKIEKQFELDTLNQNTNKNIDTELLNEMNEEKFDFITGVGLQQQEEFLEDLQLDTEEEQEEKEEEIESEFQMEPQNKNDIEQTKVKKEFIKLYENYESQISNAFIRKDLPKGVLSKYKNIFFTFLLKRIKKKHPKLFITSKANKLQKVADDCDEIELLMRVYNREHIASKPYVLVPTFESKKDCIANNVLAYLKDYKPLLSGNKANIPKSIEGLLDVELEYLKTINDNTNFKEREITEKNFKKEAENELNFQKKTLNLIVENVNVENQVQQINEN